MEARHPTFPTRSRRERGVRRAALAAAFVLALSARGAELFVPELFYARVPDRTANEDLVTISVEAEPAEGAPGSCALSVRSDEDDVLLVVEYAVAVASGDQPCSLRLSCRADPVALEADAPGLTDLAGRPSPDAAARADSMLPWCGLLAVLEELSRSGRRPAEFFADDALVASLASDCAALAASPGATTGAARGGDAAFLCCVHASRGDLAAALVASAASADAGPTVSYRFPGGFRLRTLVAACAGPSARRVLPLVRRFLGGDAAGCLDEAEALLRGRAARPNFQQISNNCTPRSVVDYAPSRPATEQPAPRPPPKKFQNRERFGRESRL